MGYRTDTDFRKALEERLRQRAEKDGEPLIRLRKRVVFERTMVRLQQDAPTPWVLKGGFALELRMGNLARMTKDLDLTVDVGFFSGETTSTSTLSDRLREDLKRENEDRFSFQVAEGSEEELPTQGVKSFRFLVETRLDGRRFENIKIDVGVGDPLIPPMEEIKGSDLLSFAGILAPIIRVTSRAQHFAEKIHALTRPFDDRINTRVKDLADLMLFAEHGLPRKEDVKVAVTKIFENRKTHEIPSSIGMPPVTWATSYSAMASQLNLKEKTIENATSRLNDYWKTFSKGK
jgi:predicted nucleotidyltransferase component of viral defense system